MLKEKVGFKPGNPFSLLLLSFSIGKYYGITKQRIIQDEELKTLTIYI
jgi:hypothetical protein